MNMSHIAVIGAGITGTTTAYALLKRGYKVSIFEKHPYAAMETSFANGGQLSASNAEVWNSVSTIIKGVKWMFKPDAPLLLNPTPSWHKYSWLAEFMGQVRNYRENTIETTRLAIAARQHLYDMAKAENIDFNLEHKGILHIYRDQKSFDQAAKTNQLLQEGGLDRRAVTASEIRQIEPTLESNSLYGGFYTPSDSTGDIHKYSTGLLKACERLGATLYMQCGITSIEQTATGHTVSWDMTLNSQESAKGQTTVDGVVICGGVASRDLAASLGDRINIYPVKGYSITVMLNDEDSQTGAPYVSLLDEDTKIVTSRLGKDRFRVAGTAEFNGMNKDIRADRIAPLVNWTRRYFPKVSTEHAIPWTGLRPMTPNMLPKVGAGSRKGIFYNTGHGHLGWTLSAITAEMVAHDIQQSPLKAA
jgi:D-amino-acid dehydrogenase